MSSLQRLRFVRTSEFVPTQHLHFQVMREVWWEIIRLQPSNSYRDISSAVCRAYAFSIMADILTPRAQANVMFMLCLRANQIATFRLAKQGAWAFVTHIRLEATKETTVDFLHRIILIWGGREIETWLEDWLRFILNHRCFDIVQVVIMISLAGSKRANQVIIVV